jgi:hypothetical protein
VKNGNADDVYGHQVNRYNKGRGAFDLYLINRMNVTIVGRVHYNILGKKIK